MAKINPELRKKVYERDNFTCLVCDEKVILTKDIRTEDDYSKEASIDHIVPLSKGGETKEENLRTICRGCNSRKGDREDPDELKFLNLNRGEFTRIANSIINALARTRLNSEENRVVLAIIAKTYGFNKSEDWVSNSQLEIITGIHKSHCSRTVTRLKKRNILLKVDNKIKLNKYFFKWLELPKQATVTKTGNKSKLPKQETNVAKVGIDVLPEQAYTKDNTKDNTKERGADSPPTPKDKTKFFFKGITDFLQKIQSEEAEAMKELLRRMSVEQGIESLTRKKIFWDEIVKFGDYWQEKDHLGKREKWQLEKTFEVEKRLQTWLRRAGQWSKPVSQNNNKGRGFA